jgi:uncharacterized integral membrane protein (TIGR00698 family)
MTDSLSDPKRRALELEKYAHLDSMEGLTTEFGAKPPGRRRLEGAKRFMDARYLMKARHLMKARRLMPGVLTAIVVGLAASFLSGHYGGPVMFFALLIGLAFDFLSGEEKTRSGIDFSARTILRFGVALLGARITIDQILSLGLGPVLAVIGAVIFTITCSAGLARLMGLTRAQGLLFGGAVAICGASAALALSSVMPQNEYAERNTIFTVVLVTTLSTIAMIVYPILVIFLGFGDTQAGIFLGGTIHDVAQVVGAGYTVSETAGDTATIVKLLRVSMLLPTVLVYTFIFRGKGVHEKGSRLATIPPFLIAFAALVTLNSLDIMPPAIMSFLGELSRWCLVTAIAALGMKTSFKALALIGWRPVFLMVSETLLMALFVLGFLFLS